MAVTGLYSQLCQNKICILLLNKNCQLNSILLVYIMELLFSKTAPSKQELGLDFNSEEKSGPVESNQYVSLSNCLQNLIKNNNS